MTELKQKDAELAMEMIRSLIKFNSEERKPVQEILKSAYFAPKSENVSDENSCNPDPRFFTIFTCLKYL